MQINLEKEKLLKIAKKYHAHQTRTAGKTPYWFHILSVAQIVQNAFNETQELKADDPILRDILLAALGHDLYEDTKINRKYIQENCGKYVDELIWFLTNEVSDYDRSAYVKKITQAPDEAKIIKLADLTENTISVAYTIHDLGAEWVHSFFLPIIEEMKDNVSNDKFKKYKKTANLLNIQFNFALSRLYENVRKYEL